MKRTLSLLFLSIATLTFAQLSVAEETPALRYKLVDQNHAAMKHYPSHAQAE